MLFFANPSYWLLAQNYDFYYLLNDKKENLTCINGKYVVGFKSPIDSSSPLLTLNILAEKLFGNVYYTFNPSLIAQYDSNYYIHPAYIGSHGSEIFYAHALVLKFKPDVSEANKNSLIAAFGLALEKTSLSFERYTTIGDPLPISKAIYESGLVTYCTPEVFCNKVLTAIPNDEYFIKQWYLHNTGQGTNDGATTLIDADIDAPEAWDITTGNSNIIIAVVDVGVTWFHPDLPSTRQIRLLGSNLVPQASSNLLQDPDNPEPDQLIQTGINTNHGNACAGIIAASQNNINGISGIAPNCKIMPFKVAFDNINSWADFASIIDMAVLNNANIVSNSWGAYNPTDPAMIIAMNNAIANKVLLIYSAGNTADHLFNIPGYLLAPSYENIEGMIAVGSSDRNNGWANYSPAGDGLDIVAPSNHESDNGIPGETNNIWTLDVPGQFGNNPWYTTGILPSLGEQLPTPNSGTCPDCYSGRFSGTSASAPQVAGVAALMLSVNECLTPYQIQDILQSSTDQIASFDYHNHDYIKQGHSIELGYGKLNAFKAVKGAQLSKPSNPVVDLFTKDIYYDIGIPGTPPVAPFGTGADGDRSPDIWVRNQPDGLVNQFHENPEFQTIQSIPQPVYVYVRVRNKSCQPSIGSEVLNVYWSYASTWSSWPQNWDGSLPNTGNVVGQATIPSIPPGGYTIVEIPWTPLNPNAPSTNICLLSRLYDGEIISVTPNQLNEDITNNNNISILNLKIVDVNPNSLAPPYYGDVLVGNILNHSEYFNIHIEVPDIAASYTNDITEDAEVKIEFSQEGWDLLYYAGHLNQPGIKILREKEIQITAPNITFTNVLFPENLRIQFRFHFNFLTDQISEADRYFLIINQVKTDNQTSILGTQTFVINRTSRDPFTADAGDDILVQPNENVTLEADDIGESAIYNWYDEQNNLVYSGRFFELSTSTAHKYRLEIVSTIDGYKDYDDVQVNIQNNFLQSISPNPNQGSFDLTYTLNENVSSAYVVITKPFTNLSISISLNVSSSSQIIELNNLASGVYNIQLFVNSNPAEIKSFQIIN